MHPHFSRSPILHPHFSHSLQPEEHDSKPFKLLKLIGRGGFGNVYLADWEDGERVAIKIIQVEGEGL